MSDTTPRVAQGDEYVVLFSGGPFDGQTERRISTDGSWDDEVTVIVSQEGMDTQLVYAAKSAVDVGHEVHVTYTWDQLDSEELEDPMERNDR